MYQVAPLYHEGAKYVSFCFRTPEIYDNIFRNVKFKMNAAYENIENAVMHIVTGKIGITRANLTISKDEG